MAACPPALIDVAQTKASDEMQCKLDELASQKSTAASEKAMSASIDRVVKLAIKKVRERAPAPRPSSAINHVPLTIHPLYLQCL